MALLSANCYRSGPWFDVHIINKQYRVDSTVLPGGNTDADLAARPATFIPSAPDVVFEVTSEAENARLIAEEDAQSKLAEEKAGQLFKNRPDFWPERNADPYPWVKDETGGILLEKRWESASKKPLGTKEDIDSICATVTGHRIVRKSGIRDIRWLSPSLVLVASGWYRGYLASAGYTYVLQKRDGRWTVIAYYMEFVS